MVKNIAKFTSELQLAFFSITIGIIFRLYFIVERDFWFDEAFTFFVAQLPLSQVVHAVLTDNNPPLYYLFMHAVVRLTHSPLLLRLPSLALNIGSAFILYKLIFKLFKCAALKSVILFSLSPLTIYLGSNARLHAMGMFFGILLIWYFQKLIVEPTRLNSLRFILIALLALYSHYYIVLLMIAMSLWVLKNQAELSLKKWLLLCSPIVVGFLPWVTAQMQNKFATCACPPTFLSLPVTFLTPILGGIGEVTFRQYTQLPILTIIFFAIASMYFLSLFYKGIFKTPHILTFLYFVPLMLISIAGIISPIFSPKGFSVFAPMYLALIAIGISSTKNNKYTVVAIVVLIMLNIIQISDPFFSGTPVRPIIEVTKLRPDLPVFHTSSITYYSSKFYLPTTSHLLLTKNPFSEATVDIIGGEVNLDMTAANFWLVDTKNWVHPDERAEILIRMEGEYNTLHESALPQLTVKLLERK